jgi:hypothetical protein
VIKTCYNNGQKERLCLIIDKCRRQKLCKRAQKISAAEVYVVAKYEFDEQRKLKIDHIVHV